MPPSTRAFSDSNCAELSQLNAHPLLLHEMYFSSTIMRHDMLNQDAVSLLGISPLIRQAPAARFCCQTEKRPELNSKFKATRNVRLQS